MSAIYALARAELVMLARNRVAMATAVLIPIVAGVWLVTSPPPDDVPGGVVAGITALMLLLLTGMTVATTATTTLVARRQQRLLERWRISGAATVAVLAGTLAPVMLVAVGGNTLMLAATGYAFDALPAQPLVLIVTVGLAAALGGAVAVVTAGHTRTVEAAQLTLLPAVAAILGGGFWVVVTPPSAITWQMRITGGGALAELVRIGWDGPAASSGSAATLTAAAPAALALLALIAALTLIATRTFRWSARG